MDTPVIKKGTELTLQIESLAFGGQGVARTNGYVVFVEGGLPGQEVLARVFRKRKGYAEAFALRIIRQSSETIEPRCPHFGECGGCRFQNLAYLAQLKYKQQQVRESLVHLGGMAAPVTLDTLASPDQFYYRNKMEFSFGGQRWLPKAELDLGKIVKPKNFALGLHVRGRFDKILDVDTCYLQSAESSEIVNFVRSFVLESQTPPYDTRDHSGFWRHLVIREGKNTAEVMVNLVTASGYEYAVVDELANQLANSFPAIATVVHSINRKKAQVAVGDEERILVGPGTIKEQIGGKLFQISANSFLQTNTKAAEILYDKVMELAEFKGDEVVYDFYCGAGTIALYVADKVKQVVGFEAVASAVKDAKVNAELNGVDNCIFVPGDLKDTVEENLARTGEWGMPDVMIIDPPRAGMHSRVVEQVLELSPERIIYVSCNPATFARDAKILCQSKYELKVVQPVDMFPHTPHIEVVSLLKAT